MKLAKLQKREAYEVTVSLGMSILGALGLAAAVATIIGIASSCVSP